MPIDALALLRAATTYAIDSTTGLTPHLLTRRTPCANWDLRRLLRHADDSVQALIDGLGTGYIGLDPRHVHVVGTDPVVAFRTRLDRLQVAALASNDGTVALADRMLPVGVVALVGAVELAVHGWDINQARGCASPIPSELADDLLYVAERTIRPDRHPEFGPPVPIPSHAASGARLIAFLGRRSIS
ncbi:TIGR03086 family metal-binding protein [Nocardia sp. CA-135398]|uniref:TIGR03086 family metal-binding protein n=1 Tax=Nocardia sp. CA-135398 TaxID=3239977 RepID=UPI003D99DC4A